MATLTATLLPREVADAQFSDIRKMAQNALDAANEAQAEGHGKVKAQQGITQLAQITIAGLGVLVAVLSIVVVVILANGHGP
jgi:hypothetical protein